ncbi:MAG: SURF1 family protein [Rhodanobacteraceae bacterium]|nr:SURF1 family protein [Rhodanobacteraceae bacterium]
MLGLAVFLGLSRWQWGRGQEKEHLLNSYTAAANSVLLDYAKLPDPLPADDYPRVAVQGRYVAGRGYWLDQQVHEGKVGRRAIAVFEPRGASHRLLVNLGWVAAPVGQPPPAWPDLPSMDLELHGIYAPAPGGGLRIGGDALPRQAGWPKLMLFVDIGAIARDLAATVAPRLLLLDADSASGFVRSWTPAALSPEKHRGYALQWFSFAIAVVVIFVVLHWRKD